MKKLLIGLAMAFIMIFPSFAFPASKTLLATWEQDLPDPNDLAGWKLYKSMTQGGPYVLEKTITYVSPQTTYTDNVPVVVPDNQVTKLYFVLTAFDTSGNESAYSVEASITLDFGAPGVPMQLKFTVVAQ